ncbi:siderophore-interacting protein [Agrobacterium rhizogenes]|uniref:siderophore-interacting protein n=1 Tax=Rhizobium rhizogenes TaxID=359 RepID=UPI0015746E51|nr:siderophore-interacting protein [Rhizobium rhizogenes]NTG51303.1 siderophore-interacting protein [Rhizobium rhizogenes]
MTKLTSRAEVALPTPKQYLAEVFEHFAEEVPTTLSGAMGSAVFPWGIGTIEVTDQGLRLYAEAGDLPSLATVRDVMASHLEEFAWREKPDIRWNGDGCDSSVVPNLRIMTVATMTDLTARMRRITLKGENLDWFTTGDPHIWLLFPPADLEVPEWPVLGPNGRPAWPPYGKRPTTRTYTIRRIDVAAGEIDVDFVLHGDQGVASAWAETARAGDVIGMMGPGGGGMPAMDWCLLAGDETAIPAIARMLESLPETAQGIVLIEVADKGEEQTLLGPAGIDIRWLHRNGEAAGRSRLLEGAVKAIRPPSDVSFGLWAGAESATARALRTYWRRDLGLSRANTRAISFWKLGFSESDHQRPHD